MNRAGIVFVYSCSSASTTHVVLLRLIDDTITNIVLVDLVEVEFDLMLPEPNTRLIDKCYQ